MASTEVGKAVFGELLAENARYLQGNSLPQSELASPELREELAAKGQKPVAAVIACADSRVAPEIVFGAGLGRVFAVRNAGNVAWGDSVVGSVEYAVGSLGVPLVLVLGHTMCGAIGAAVAVAKNGEGLGESPLGLHVDRIADVVKEDVEKGNGVAEAVVTNVKDGVARLLSGDTLVATKAKAGEIAVMGAVYNIVTGEVTAVE